MRIFPAVHYTMGGLWVDYNLESTIPGLFVMGEANFSDHGANRLGASALMQGLADGYYVAPVSVGNYLGGTKLDPVDTDHDAFKASQDAMTKQDDKLLGIQGEKTVDEIFKQLGNILWEKCGMSRKAEWLEEGIQGIQELREEFWQNVKVTGSKGHLNNDLEMAGRLSDFLEMGELMCRDALERKESCGGHFREESQTPECEALRDDENFQHVAAWEHVEGKEPVRHIEPLSFEYVTPSQRSYK
jgi:succinate dehydrogenase / fumarate reductase flavoprotein subunit